MLMVDMRNTTARISLREIATSGRRYGSNPVAFSSFMAGVQLGPDLLMEEVWQNSASAASGFSLFRTLMHGVLPRFYDVRHLEKLGGRFALRLDGAGRRGEFTVIALNRRVVTLSGLPLDEANGGAVVDSSIRADVFLALWNDLLAAVAETTLNRIGATRAAQPAT
jgi:hypothetical protein